MQLRQLLYQHITWRAFAMLLQFVFNILFARYFQADTSGAILYVFAVNAFVIQLTGLSLEAGIGYFGSTGRMDAGKLAAFALLWAFAATFLSALILLLWHGVSGIEPSFPISYSIIFIAGNLLIAYANALFYAKLNFVVPNVISVSVNAILLVGIIFLYLADTNYATYFVLGYFSSFLLHGVLLYIFLYAPKNRSVPKFHLNIRELGPLFRFSFKAFVANLLFLGVTRIDFVFLRYFRTPVELGNYIQVSKIAQVFFVLPSLISAVLFPFIASGESIHTPRIVRKISLYLVLAYSLCCLLLAIGGSRLFEWVYGASFNLMYLPFLLLIPGILAISGVYPYTAYFAARNKITVNIYGALAAFLFISIADAIFVPLYGIVAASAISSGGYIIYYVYATMCFRKEHLQR